MLRSIKRALFHCLAVICVVLVAMAVTAQAKTLGRQGAGWLESVDGYLVLHLKGTPYEMGLQHGKLLGDHVRENLRFILQEQGDKTLVAGGPLRVTAKSLLPGIVEVQRPYVAAKYWDEMRRAGRGRRSVRGRRAVGQLHSGAVSLQRVCRDEYGDRRWHALPWPRVGLWRRLAVAGACCTDRRGTDRRNSVRQRQLCWLYRIGDWNERPTRFDWRDGRPWIRRLAGYADVAARARSARDGEGLGYRLWRSSAATNGHANTTM